MSALRAAMRGSLRSSSDARSILLSLALVGVLVATGAWGGKSDFVSISVLRTDDSLTVAGKKAGLGDEEQVHIVGPLGRSQHQPR